MKIAIYSPYLDTAGGGEKYILTIAEYLSQKEDVEVLLDNNLFQKQGEIKEKIFKLHSINIKNIKFVKAPIGKGSSFFKRLLFLRNYDLMFYLTDGSIFFSTAKKSFLHFQVPFSEAPTGIWGNLKLKTWHLAIYNSFFTKNIVEQNWTINGRVIYPPVSTNLFKPLHKKKQILSVGRFFSFLKTKKHELLINTFKQLTKEYKLKNWSLHLVGAAGQGDKKYIDELKKISKGSPIYFYPNITLKDLVKLYGQSLIYWHAAGFKEVDPKNFEHFGISTVEAMAAGCIPVVINSGGQKEIIEDQISGLLWDNTDDLKSKTYRVIKDPSLVKKISITAQKKANYFSKNKFIKNIQQLVYE